MFGSGWGEDENVRVQMDDADDNGEQRTNFDQITSSSLDPSALVSYN